MLPDLSIFPHQVHSLYFLRWYYSHAVLLYAVNPRIRGELSLNLALKNLFSRLTAGPDRQSPSVQPQQRQVRRFQPFSHRLRFSSTEIMRGLNIFRRQIRFPTTNFKMELFIEIDMLKTDF